MALTYRNSLAKKFSHYNYNLTLIYIPNHLTFYLLWSLTIDINGLYDQLSLTMFLGNAA